MSNIFIKINSKSLDEIVTVDSQTNSTIELQAYAKTVYTLQADNNTRNFIDEIFVEKKDNNLHIVFDENDSHPKVIIKDYFAFSDVYLVGQSESGTFHDYKYTVQIKDNSKNQFQNYKIGAEQIEASWWLDYRLESTVSDIDTAISAQHLVKIAENIKKQATQRKPIQAEHITQQEKLYSEVDVEIDKELESINAKNIDSTTRKPVLTNELAEFSWWHEQLNDNIVSVSDFSTTIGLLGTGVFYVANKQRNSYEKEPLDTDANNTVVYNVKDNEVLNTGKGFDTLVLSQLSDTIELDTSNIKNIEKLTMIDDKNQLLLLSKQDVLDLTDSDNKLFVSGNKGDSLQLTDFKNSDGKVEKEGVVYDVFVKDNVNLYVDINIQVL